MLGTIQVWQLIVDFFYWISISIIREYILLNWPIHRWISAADCGRKWRLLLRPVLPTWRAGLLAHARIVWEIPICKENNCRKGSLPRPVIHSLEVFTRFGSNHLRLNRSFEHCSPHACNWLVHYRPSSIVDWEDENFSDSTWNSIQQRFYIVTFWCFWQHAS